MSSSSVSKVEFDGPERLGYFSCQYDLTNGLTYLEDKSALRHFVSPFEGENYHIDLLDGFPGDQRWRQRPSNELFIFKWFKLNYKDTQQEKPDFICDSRTLRSFLSGDFKDKNKYEMIAVKVGDSIVIEQRLIHQHNRSEQRSKTAASLYTDSKFIEMSTSNQDGSRPETGPGGYLSTFQIVNRSRIGNHTLLYSHPVHCIVDKDQYEKPLDEMKFAKLVLRRNYFWNHPDRIHLWQSREVDWWCDFILSGVDTIYCGEKGQRNRLEQIVEINAKSLPRNTWSTGDCLQRLNSILTLVKETVTKDWITSYKLELDPNEIVSFTEFEENFFPFWYKKSTEMSSVNIGQWFSKQTLFHGPRRLGYFSLKYDDSAQLFTYHADKSALRYFTSPFKRNEVHLLDGFTNIVKQRRTKQLDMFILRWFVDNYSSVKEPSPDFICKSLLLRSILEGVFGSEWELTAVKVGDSIIIEEVLSEQFKLEHAELFDTAKAETLFTGIKFIELSTRHQDYSKMEIKSKGYRDTLYTVNRSQIGDHSLLYSHNVECIISKDEYEKPIEEMEFARLLLRYGLYWKYPKQVATWESRKVLWWIEFILSGVDNVYIGEKTSRNILSQIVKIDAKSLLLNSRKSPDDCFKGLDSTLSFIKKIVTKDLVPYKFEHNPEGEPVYTELDEPVENFIPDWFIDHQDSFGF